MIAQRLLTAVRFALSRKGIASFSVPISELKTRRATVPGEVPQERTTVDTHHSVQQGTRHNSSCINAQAAYELLCSVLGSRLCRKTRFQRYSYRNPTLWMRAGVLQLYLLTCLVCVTDIE